MSVSTRYPTGTDYQVYLTDPLEPDTAFDQWQVTPGFTDLDPLDVKNVSIVEDGEITPLFHISRQTADHFAYSRRVVNGQLQLNYSEDHMERHRKPGLQEIRDKTLWIVLDYTDWSPVRRVRDIYRIGAVWEHPFRHEPQPHAAEQVPFSGRDLTLVERKTAAFDSDLLGELSRSGGEREIQADQLFRERKNRYMATVQSVPDGDTLKVSLDASGQEITIRLAGVDTMETPQKLGKEKKANPGRGQFSRWWWPSDVAPPSYYSGPENKPVHPTQPQLDEWGIFVGQQVRNWLPQGSKVWLVTDQGTAPKGAFGRYIFRVDPVQPLPMPPGRSGETTNLGRHLIKCGYAIPYPSDSVAAGLDGNYENVSARIDRLYNAAKDAAGTSEANGVWYSPDLSKWKQETGL